MLKRFFDLLVATIILVVTFPIMLIIAFAIRVDSLGPALYRSPRVGQGGRIAYLVRFRTVDLRRPATLPMRERLTRVGRFIRHYSLDDLPDLLDVLTGDLSLIGPRPMEPERVDLTDPIWQQILTVRPGMLSPAILQLGERYNSSPDQLKQQLELAYVQQQSFWLDLQLFGRVVRQLIITRGNLKRGKPQIDLT